MLSKHEYLTKHMLDYLQSHREDLRVFCEAAIERQREIELILRKALGYDDDADLGNKTVEDLAREAAEKISTLSRK